MSILYRVLAYAGLAAIVFVAGVKFGYDYLSNKVEAERVASLEQSRATEQKWQEDFNLNARNLTHEINSIAADRDALRVRYLAERRARMPESSRVECQGGTGAELSGPDAAFLVGAAARADTIREALISCYSAFAMSSALNR